ncbi:MAG TPA: hypothetical protein VF711_08855 [Acidimicrobiales bacterium]
MAEEGITTPEGPTALPGRGARAVAFAAILVAGACGLLIGNAFVGLQCAGDCGVQRGLGAFAGAVMAAAGVAVIAVLVLRAMGEWRAGESGRGQS